MNFLKQRFRCGCPSKFLVYKIPLSNMLKYLKNLQLNCVKCIHKYTYNSFYINITNIRSGVMAHALQSVLTLHEHLKRATKG